MTPPRSAQPRVFISYARVDNESSDPSKRWLDRLLVNLKPLELQRLLDAWADAELPTGGDWHRDIQFTLQNSVAAVLLVSPAFLASEYIRNSELPVLLKNAKEKGVQILPVVLRPCLFKETKFKYPDPNSGPEELSLSSIMTANEPRKPLNSLSESEQDEVLLSVAQRLIEIVQQSSSKWQAAQASTPERLPTNLPSPATPFIGREVEIAERCELLRQPTTRLLTLTGSGGIGKTRAALQLARLCAEKHTAEFSDGIWWVNLADDHTGDAMLQNIASVLHFSFQSPPSAKEQILGLLRERQTLLVLDNLEQIPDAGVHVNELLQAAPQLKLLATSRRTLGLIAEQVKEVEPLPPSEAEDLFETIARARRPNFTFNVDNAPLISEICRRLDGVPLAIVLAASRIGMGPQQILKRLEERFLDLESHAPDLPPRHRALRATMGWSYNLLSESNKWLFAQLAVFAGGFTYEDVEAVCEADDVWEGVEDLLQHSLLRTRFNPMSQQDQLFMLESLREYAAEKLQAFDDVGAQARKRHAEHFLRFARERISKLRTPDEATALNQLEAEFTNVRAAMDCAMKGDHHQSCARFALVVGQFLYRRGFSEEATRRIRMGLDAIAKLLENDDAIHAELLREIAGLVLEDGSSNEARAYARDALTLYKQLHDTAGMAHAHSLLGMADRGEKNFSAGRDHLLQALQEFTEVGDVAGRATALNNLGIIEDESGNKQQAEQYYQEALRLRRQQGDKRGIAEVSTNLGALMQDQGTAYQTQDKLDEARRKWEAAEQLYHEALRIEEELTHTLGVGRVLYNLAEVAELKGEQQRAYRLSAAAESLFDKVGSPYKEYASALLTRVTSNSGHTLTEELRQSLKAKSLKDLINWALTNEPQS